MIDTLRMSKYIPPNRRETPKIVIPKQDEFPTLGSMKPKASAWSGKSFSSLATAWKDKDEDEKQKREIQEEIEKHRKHREELNNQHFIVKNKHYGNEYNQYTEDEVRVKKDEWVTIEKKIRPVLTIEEQIEREEILEKEERQRQEEEDSVWKTEEWDFRDRRVYS